MAGRRQYDNQTSIVALPKKQTKDLNLNPGNVITLAKSSSLIYQYIPEVGTRASIENFNFNIAVPTSEGATSGSYFMKIHKVSQGTRLGLLWLEFPHNTSFYYRFGYLDSSVAPSRRNPSTTAELLQLLSMVSFGEDDVLEIEVYNGTNADWVDMTCVLRLGVVEEEIA